MNADELKILSSMEDISHLPPDHFIRRHRRKNPLKRLRQEVHVLLLSWEESDLEPAIGAEIAQLSTALQGIFNVRIRQFEIPCSNNQAAADSEITSFLSETSHKSLFLVYYNGHGGLRNVEMTWFGVCAPCLDRNFAWPPLTSVTF